MTFTMFRSRTNVHYLVFHLAIADFIVSVVTMPLEAIWRFTVQVLPFHWVDTFLYMAKLYF